MRCCVCCVCQSGVSQAAHGLGGVALAVADERFSDYVAIHGEVSQHATACSTAAEQLALAAEQLQSAKDTFAPCKTVLDATKTLAAATIRLLNVVYGAGFKKFEFVIEFGKNNLLYISFCLLFPCFVVVVFHFQNSCYG